MNDTHQLTELQLAVMRVLWDRGEASVVDIWEALRPERGLAQTTVATLLSRLEKRGVVGHRRQARQFFYRATVSEPEVRRVMVRELTARLFDGDVTALVSHLLSAREVEPGDLAKVKALIEARDDGGRHDGNEEIVDGRD
jgi:BlaI family transcriptional regulator, penicillinase repressor